MLDPKVHLADLPSQLQLVDRLQHLIFFSSSFTFVSASSGSGKTTVIQRLLSSDELIANQSLLNCQVDANEAKCREILLSQVVTEPLFNPSDPCGETLFAMLEGQQAELVFVIDDAHHLPAAIVAELWLILLENKFKKLNHKINVVMFGEPVWCQQQVQLLHGKTDEPPIEMELAPLTEQECHQFVRGLFQRANYHAKIENNAAIERQIDNCNGNPAKLQQVVDIIVNAPAAKEDKKVKRNAQPLLLAGVIAAVLLMTSGIFYLLLPSEQEQPAKNEILASDIVESASLPPIVTTPTPVISKKPEALAGDWNKDSGLPQEINDSGIELKTLDDGRKQVTLTEQVLTEMSKGPAEQGKDTDKVAPVEQQENRAKVNSLAQLEQVLEASANATPVPAEQNAATNSTAQANDKDLTKSQHATSNSTAVVTDLNDDSPAEIPQETAEQAPQSQQSPTLSSTDTEPVKTKSKPTTDEQIPIITAVESVEPATETLTSNAEQETANADALSLQNEDVSASASESDKQTNQTGSAFSLSSAAELKQVSGRKFALQLAAISTLPVLEAFVKEHGIEESATYFKVYRNGKPGYLVVYGQYNSRTQANNAIAGLPNNLKLLKPWAKKYQQLQSVVVDD
ncbi:AAA family ATPase [Motilimonas pumila]|uniref:SPOR domain-containing protein n=1 Tax=Motilimonas pumila TaxID=2303987 RepID=A0A418YCU8_9GAMM|nr:AAA family ATPase [Motilimonas pumila]RJG42349.1 hypothetical protein D1Z90_13805 [Motilimonas pumila]